MKDSPFLPKSNVADSTLERRARRLLATPSWLEQLWQRLQLSGDRVFHGVLLSFACAILLLVGLLGYELVRNSWLSLTTFGLSFLTSSTWDPVAQHFGVLPFLYGTVVSSLLALCVATPLSIGVALWLTEMVPRWLAEPASFLVELLAAIPSVIYGLWGVFVLVPWVRAFVEPTLATTLGFLPLFQGPTMGIGMLTAGLILTIMILPFIISVCREMFLAVPANLREAALALGATRWEMIRLAVLPVSRSGIIGAVILGLGRAVGETMAVTMVIGNRPQIALSLFAPASTMASVIANEFTEATSELYLQALIEVGLVLLVVTVVINALARLLVWSISSKVEGIRLE